MLNCTFDDAIEKVTILLKEVGFGILTEIDVKTTLKQKINVDYKRYTILGACNPHFAHQALLTEDKLGVLLPCNVVVIEQESGTEVCIINPTSMMGQLGNDKLMEFSKKVTEKLESVVENL